MGVAMASGASRQRLSSAQRRELILDSAIRQFAERGYEAVGMRDLAGDVGLSAPGIYRHFSSKEELLVKIFDRLSDRLVDAMRSADRTPDPATGLASLIRSHIGQSIEHSNVMSILYFMADRLPPEERERFQKVSRSYLDAWVARLRQIRPELSHDSARISVHAAFGLLNSLGYHSVRLPDRSLVRHLTEMVRGALHLPPST